MIKFEKEELQGLLFALEDWRSPASDWPIYTKLKCKIENMIKILSPHKNCCQCKEEDSNELHNWIENG